MEDGRIGDHQLSSSSHLDAQHSAQYARLNQDVGAWSAGRDHQNQHQWIQVSNHHSINYN